MPRLYILTINGPSSYLPYYVYYLMDLITIPLFKITIVDASTNDKIQFSGLCPLNLIDGTVSVVI